MTSDCSTVDAQRAFQRFFLESSEADVVDSESTDSSDEVVSQSSMMMSDSSIKNNDEEDDK